MIITRYEDIREGDRVFTSSGVQTVATVEQFVSWAQVRIIRPDNTEWSTQLHDGNFGRFRFERDSLWTCPRCNGHRHVIQGFPLGGPLNPRGENLGQRRVCKSCGHSYWLAPGASDPHTVPAEMLHPSSPPRHDGPVTGSTPFLSPSTDEQTVTPAGRPVTLERSGSTIRVVSGYTYVCTVRHTVGSRVWVVEAGSLEPRRFRTGTAAWAHAWLYVDGMI